MILSTAGAIVQGFWFEIPKHFNHVQLGEFIVMPNHLHGVLILEEMEGLQDDVETLNFNVSTTTEGKPNPKFFKKIVFCYQILSSNNTLSQ